MSLAKEATKVTKITPAMLDKKALRLLEPLRARGTPLAHATADALEDFRRKIQEQAAELKVGGQIALPTKPK